MGDACWEVGPGQRFLDLPFETSWAMPEGEHDFKATKSKRPPRCSGKEVASR